MPKLPVLGEVKTTTVGIFLLTCLWAFFQWRDPTPPPALDQILVASFGVWFANEAIDRKRQGSADRTVSVDRDGNVKVSEDSDSTTKDEDDG